LEFWCGTTSAKRWFDAGHLRAMAPAFRVAVCVWRGNVRRGMAPRGDRLLEREKLCRVKTQERYGYETGPERQKVECKAQNGEKPHVPATRER
jgi:hypothetical protein